MNARRKLYFGPSKSWNRVIFKAARNRRVRSGSSPRAYPNHATAVQKYNPLSPLHKAKLRCCLHLSHSKLKTPPKTSNSRKREAERPRNKKMHAKTDSEVTSLAPSSPTRSPRRPVYYVQSPSRDSHDGEKTTASFHSTPILSPTGSPPHSNSSLGRHSRESSTSRFSGSLKPGSRKVSTNDASRGGRKGRKEFTVIEEEGLLEDEDAHKGLPRRCYFLAFVLGFVVLFSIFSLILWGASRPQKPYISMKSITFESFIIQAGTDATGVPTDMISMNSTVKLTFRNKATFFGLHVTSTPIDLTFSELTIATGNVKNFYQSRKSQRSMNIVVTGNMIPLYGGGASFSSSTGKISVPVPLDLSFLVRSRAYVLGKLVKPKFYINVNCSVVFNPAKLNTVVSLNNSCTYDRDV